MTLLPLVVPPRLVTPGGLLRGLLEGDLWETSALVAVASTVAVLNARRRPQKAVRPPDAEAVEDAAAASCKDAAAAGCMPASSMLITV